MKFDWLSYLEFAEDTFNRILVKNKPIPPVHDHCRIRVAISKAYYAVHHKARAKIKEEDSQYELSMNLGSIHKQVIKYFKESSTLPKKSIGEKLDRMYGRRIKADYDDIAVQYSWAKASIEDAKEVLEELEKL